MKLRKRQWITVLALGLMIALLVACGAKETPAPAPTEAPAATKAPAVTEAPAATEPPAATEEVAATEPPAATEEAAAPEAPAAPSGDEKSILANSAADLKDLKSYRVKIIMEQDGQTMETLVEYVMPDRFHMVSDFAEMTVIGDDMYMKTGDTWTKVPGGGAAAAAVADVGVTEDEILEARLEGTEDVEGVPTQKYVYTAKVGDNPPVEVTAWIGVADGLPYKIVTAMEGSTVTQILYDFNADITIEPPPGVE